MCALFIFGDLYQPLSTSLARFHSKSSNPLIGTMLSVMPSEHNAVASAMHPYGKAQAASPMCSWPSYQVSDSQRINSHHQLVDDMAATEKRVPEQKANPRLSFLNLPLEIRLRIYEMVLLASPLHRCERNPWYRTPNYRTYVLQVVTRTESVSPARMCLAPAAAACPPQPAASEVGGRLTTTPTTSSYRRLLDPNRPLGYLPRALLQTCQQVYAEARALPFHANEFVFASLFSSGLTAGRAFVGCMTPWQRDGMRYARLDVRVLDLGLAGRLGEWEELCRLWSAGLLGLRLRIELEENTLRAAGGCDVWSAPAMDFRQDQQQAPPESEPQPRDPPATQTQTQARARLAVPPTWSREPWRWVDQGLAKMQALRAVEIDLVALPLSRDQREAWCAAVRDRLNAGRDGVDRRKVNVLCVQRDANNRQGLETSSHM
jgi:hypothetical protein